MKQTIQPFKVEIEGKETSIFASHPGVAISRCMQFNVIYNPGQANVPYPFWARTLDAGETLTVKVTRLAVNEGDD